MAATNSSRKPVEELACDAAAKNPDKITRRETLELDLQELGRSDEGEDVDIAQATGESDND